MLGATLTNLFENEKLHCASDVVEILSTGDMFLHQFDSAQRQFQHFTGEAEVSEIAKKNFELNHLRNLDFCTQQNIKFCHIVFPAKPIAFRSELAEAGVEVKSIFGPAHALERVHYPIEHLKSREHFYKQDTHNNDDGKLAIVKFFLNVMGISIPKLTPIYGERDVLGDLGRKLGRKPAKELAIKGFEQFPQQRKVFSTNSFLKGNSGQIDYYVNTAAPIQQRLLVFGDSFINTSLMILSNIFHEIVYLRTPFIQRDIAENLSPDIIMTSNAERYLVNTPNAVTTAPYFLHYFSEKFTPIDAPEETIKAFKALFSGRESAVHNHWLRSVL